MQKNRLIALQPWALAALQGQGLFLCLLYVLYYLSTVSWTPFLSVYYRERYLSGLQIGTLSGIGPAVMLLSQPLWGLIADLHGRRRTLLFTMLAAACLLPGFAWPGGYWFFFTWAIVQGFLFYPVSPLIDSLVLDHLERLRHVSFGQMRLWGAVGWALGAFIVGQAIAGRDIRLIFAFATGFLLMAWCVAWQTTRTTAEKVTLGKGLRGARALLGNRQLVTFLALIVLMQLGTAAIWTFHPIYLTELGAPRSFIGYAVSIRGLSEIPIWLLSAVIFQHIGSRWTLRLTFFLFAARVLAYSIIKAPVLAMAVEATHGISFSLFLAASVHYIHQLVPRQWRATGQALLTAAFFGAGGILGNTLSGYLYDHLGVQPMYRINAMIVLAVALAALFVLQEPHPAESAD